MSFSNSPVTNYDIMPDGKHFIMVQNTRSSGRKSAFNYVQNWVKELEEKVK